MPRIRRFCLTFCLAIPWITFSSLLLAQSSDCTGKTAQAQLSATDPAYVDAMDLTRYLIDHGFVVKCVLESKQHHQFNGQTGAALYRTDRGDFEALFLPPGKTFDDIKIVEERQGARFHYSFRGTPQSPANIDSSKQIYYVKFRNVLF
jgi:hypothetical protein